MQAARLFFSLVLSIAVAFYWNAALAFPEGAPWGAADPTAEQSCASCHFGIDPVRDSQALTISGLPQVPRPGFSYNLEVKFQDPDIVVAGFQLLARSAEHSAGTFVSGAADVEVIETAVRSTAPISGNDSVSWLVGWRAPDVVAGPIDFYAAALSANDDGSPFGDTIHFRFYRLAAE